MNQRKQQAKSDAAPPERPAEPVDARNPRRSRFGWLLAAIALTLLPGYTVVTWQRYERLRSIQAGLPLEPVAVAATPGLQQRIRAAMAQTRAARTARVAVADLGRLYQANTYRREAEACWRVLLQHEPKNPRWPYYLAALLQFDGRTVEAAEQLERTVKAEPDYAPAWLELAALKFRTGDPAGAERCYQRHAALRRGDPYSAFGLARIALLREQRGEARGQLENIVRDHPSFSPARNLYAEMLAAAGDNEGAESQRWLGRIAGRYREADDPWLEELRVFCFDPSQLAVWGKIDFEAKHGDRGKALFARALEVAPGNPIGHEALGEWYLESGDVATALNHFTQAVQLPRPGLSLFVNLAATFRRLGEPAETLRAVQRGLAAIPDASELYFELGVAFDDLGRLEEAMAAYRTAIKRSPNAAAAHVNLAVNLLKAGVKAEAYENLQLALKAQPTMPKALGMLGDLELAAGDLEAAAGYIRPLYRFYPGLPRARRAMAQWHAVAGAKAAGSGRFEDAERAFQEAIKIDPDSIDARGQLGILYGQKGRYQDALPQFEAVYKLQPTDPRPAMFLGMAYAQLGRKEDARRILREGEGRAVAANRPEIAARCRELLLGLP